MENYKNSKIGRIPPKSTRDIQRWNAPRQRIPLQAPRMTLQNRAKIFSPFSPLRGYDDEQLVQKSSAPSG